MPRAARNSAGHRADDHAGAEHRQGAPRHETMKDRGRATRNPQNGSDDGWLLPLVLGWPGGALDGEGGLGFDDLGNVAAAHAEVESALFALLGRFASSEEDDMARLLFDSRSAEHASHAELWGKLADSQRAGSSAPGGKTGKECRAARALELLGRLEEEVASAQASSLRGSGRTPSEATILRLGGLARVVIPRLLAGYEQHRLVLSFPLDGPSARVLRLVREDVASEWVAIEALLEERTARSPGRMAALRRLERRLEDLVATLGVGLVPLPARLEA